MGIMLFQVIPELLLTTSWLEDDSVHGVFNNRATEQSRGMEKGGGRLEK